MVPHTKFLIVRTLLWASMGISVFCLYRVFNTGYSDSRVLIEWFWALLASVFVTLCIAVVYYYYRTKRQEQKTQEEVAAETLAELAKRDDGVPKRS